MELNLLDYIFPEMTVGVVLFTMILRTQVSRLIQAKWLTLAVGAFGGIVQYLLHIYETPTEPFALWKVLNSVGIAVIFYDYVVKVVKDWIAGRNPLKNG